MQPEEVDRITAALGGRVVAMATLAGGFSHETALLTLADGGRVVARLGGPDPAVEAAVMATARQYVPVPRVLVVTDGARPAMVLEYVAGTPLDHVLAGDGLSRTELTDLGAEVGRVVAGIGTARFDRPGFFADEMLTVGTERPWSRQLPEVAVHCMTVAPEARLDRTTRRAWVDLCTAHAPALRAVDDHTRLVHADINPKNILVTHTRAGWRVDAVLDWEFSYSGCPYGDPANMARFGADYPAGFLDGFRTAFSEHRPAGLALAEDWEYLGRVLDMFALSDLAARPAGHPIADQAAERIRHWVAEGVPRSS
jgi:Ser/Thr protein kinase RdoA (MazF antagonist)